MHKSILSAIDSEFEMHISAFFWDRGPAFLYLDEIIIGG